MDTGVPNKALVPTPGNFTTGANIGNKNMGEDLRPTGSTRPMINKMRNLRGAAKQHYNKEGQVSIPVNPNPKQPPSV